MKDWKTYAIIILAAWCAYLSWRVTPAIIWRANDYQMHSREDVYWWFGEDPKTSPKIKEYEAELRCKWEEMSKSPNTLMGHRSLRERRRFREQREQRERKQAAANQD